MAHIRNGARRNGTAPTRVLIAGGGVAALETMIALHHLAPERVQVELVAPERDYVYRPMLVAEPFGRGAARRFSLGALTASCGATFRWDAVTTVHPGRHHVTTRSGKQLDYDALVIASGARTKLALPGAVTFWGSGDATTYRDLLNGIEDGSVTRIVFSVPGPPSWPLPLYELAMMSATYAAEHAPGDVSITIVTPEGGPLELFGTSASEAVMTLLERHGIRIRCSTSPAAVAANGLRVVPDELLPTDRVVTLPALAGPFLDDVPYDREGFIPTDSRGRVEGLEDLQVYAAGDVTTFPIKQGGLAAQWGDAVAETVAAEAGAPIEPTPLRPTLRGLLLTGSEPRLLGAGIANGVAKPSPAAGAPLWWPPGKIAGRYLAPHLASLAKRELWTAPPDGPAGMPVEVELGA